MLNSHFKSCYFSTKDIHSICAVSKFLRKVLKFSTGRFSVKNIFSEAVKNSLYMWSAGLVRIYLQNSPPKLTVMVRLYIATAGLNKNILATCS